MIVPTIAPIKQQTPPDIMGMVGPQSREIMVTKVEIEPRPVITVTTISPEPSIITYNKTEAYPGSYKPVWMEVKATAYCPCRKCCGRWSRHKKTTSGRSAYLAGVAVDRKIISLGSFIDIPDYPYGPNTNGSWIEADDTGSEVVGHHIDVRFPAHWEALEWARKHSFIRIRVWVKQ